MDEEKQELGKRITALRKERKLSRVELSKMTGISVTLLYKYETGQSSHFYVDTAGKLCKALNIGLGELLGWDMPEENAPADAQPEDFSGTHVLPVYSAFTGNPPVPVGKPLGRVSVLAPDIKSAGELFAMKVTDDSLLAKDIVPGDVLVIRKGGKTRDGRLVAVVYESDVEIRQIEHEADAVVLFTPGATDVPEKFDFAKLADGTIHIIGECVFVARCLDSSE